MCTDKKDRCTKVQGCVASWSLCRASTLSEDYNPVNKLLIELFLSFAALLSDFQLCSSLFF